MRGQAGAYIALGPATTNPCTSLTRTGTCEVDCNPGIAPPLPPPRHTTFHTTVAVTVKASPGSPADDRRYTYPQSGDTDAAGNREEYGVPGPSQCAEPPSPIDHTTRCGVAVAVTTTPGTSAVLDTGCHPLCSTHSHVGTPTTCAPPVSGFIRITGDGNSNRLNACRATAAGDTGAPPSFPAVDCGPW